MTYMTIVQVSKGQTKLRITVTSTKVLGVSFDRN